MPLYHFRCGSCNTYYRRILTPTEAKTEFNCTQADCNGFLKREPKAPTSQTMERLDNGLMVEALERPADVERLISERAKKDPMQDD